MNNNIFPREFWLGISETNKAHVNYKQVWSTDYHVIEYKAYKEIKEENSRLMKIISKELNENDEFGSEFVITTILRTEIEILNKKLKIAVDALENIRSNDRFCDTNHSNKADDALISIEEIENETNPPNS